MAKTRNLKVIDTGFGEIRVQTVTKAQRSKCVVNAIRNPLEKLGSLLERFQAILAIGNVR